MKLKENRYSLAIEPNSEVEIAFMEEVLNLRKASDTCTAKRVNVMGVDAMAYLELKKDDVRERNEARPSTLAEHICESSEVPTEAISVANFAKLMYKHAGTVKAMYSEVSDMQLRLLECVNESYMTEAAVLCMMLLEAKHDKKA